MSAPPHQGQAGLPQQHRPHLGLRVMSVLLQELQQHHLSARTVLQLRHLLLYHKQLQREAGVFQPNRPGTSAEPLPAPGDHHGRHPVPPPDHQPLLHHLLQMEAGEQPGPQTAGAADEGVHDHTVQ